MAQHGYLGEGYGTHGQYDEEFRDRDRDRESGWDRDRERARGDFMFDRDRDNRSRFGRDREEAREWFGGDDYQREDDLRSGQRSRSQDPRGQRGFSSHPDDHYRSWRDRQMQALDRDYQDYCREREQQFHQEFDQWRSNRQQGGQQTGGSGSMPAGMSVESGRTEGPTPDTMELTQPARAARQRGTPES